MVHLKVALDHIRERLFSWFIKKEKDEQPMWLVVGLGNPGNKYKNNRYNIGFMVLDEMASNYGFSSYKSKFDAHISENIIGNQKVVLLKPQTYMNNSGQAVQKAAKFYKIRPDRIIVFHDELDLHSAKFRVKIGGGVAGHNGLKSIKSHLETPDYIRVRMGIDHPGDKSRVSGYVLSDFSKSEKNWVEPLVKACSDHIGILLKGENELYMTKVSHDMKEIKIDNKKMKKEG